MIIRIVLAFIFSCSLSFAGQGMGPGPGVKGYSGGGANYQLSTCYLYVNDANAAGENTQMAVYNSSGTKIADSSPVAIGSSGFPKVIAHTFTSGPTLTPSSKYYVAFAGDGYINFRVKSSPGWAIKYAARGTWPSTATSINPLTDSVSANPEIGMYCTNSTGEVLLGTSTLTAFTDIGSQDGSNNTVYLETGYVCATL